MSFDAPRSRPDWMLAASVCLLCSIVGLAQQVPDTAFKPPVEHPAFAVGHGPVVAIDEAHFNFHTADGRYQPFAELLRRDGFVVRASKAQFSGASLAPVRVLVIANALSERNGRGNWSLPTPSAFSRDEIAAVKTWVSGGGSLFLIVDHMPFPGCNGELAAAFGFNFRNGFAQDSAGRSLLVFSRANGLLHDHAILQGRSAGEAVTSVTTFTGSAFRPPEGATALLIFPSGSKALEPTVAWQFDAHTPRTDVSGWSQGAVTKFGRGRVAVFGEAAMFSAQLAGPQRQPMGMNAANAQQNPQFLLNVVHWLTGVID